MHKGARTDPCGGRGVTRAPTATRNEFPQRNVSARVGLAGLAAARYATWWSDSYSHCYFGSFGALP